MFIIYIVKNDEKRPNRMIDYTIVEVEGFGILYKASNLSA